MFATARVGATLPVADLDRARRWYSEKLGLEPTRELEGQGLMYEIGGSGFMLYPSEYAGTNKATAAGFEVEDFDGAVRRLREQGVPLLSFDYGDVATVDGVMTMPDGTRGAWFADSEGNVLGVMTRQE
jgi:catechol 2,3-dioxygenase-like lactoylglutathione lyase family enzyme